LIGASRFKELAPFFFFISFFWFYQQFFSILAAPCLWLPHSPSFFPHICVFKCGSRWRFVIGLLSQHGRTTRLALLYQGEDMLFFPNGRPNRPSSSFQRPFALFEFFSSPSPLFCFGATLRRLFTLSQEQFQESPLYVLVLSLQYPAAKIPSCGFLFGGKPSLCQDVA